MMNRPDALSFGRLATAALLLAAVGAQSSWAQGLTYVDADDGFFSGNTNISPLSAFELDSGANPTDNLWHLRDGDGLLCYADTTGEQFVYEATGNSAEGEDVPEVMQTITGLSSGTSYDLYAVYWTNAESWVIQAGIQSGDLTFYDAFGTKEGATAGIEAGSAVWAAPPMIDGAPAFVAGDRTAFLGYAGTVVANASGEATAFIDDNPGGGTNSGDRTWWDGLAYAESGFDIAPVASIDRGDGALTLSNNTGLPIEFTSLSITSGSTSLDATEWLSIAGNYDEGAAGGVDDDAWEVTAPVEPLPEFAGELAEMQSAGAVDAATLASGAAPLDLGAVWQDTIYEDVQVSITLASGSTLNLTPLYTGDAHLTGDFDNSGDVTLDDYLILSANLHTDVTGLGQAESYLLGNMNGDGLLDYADFTAFAAAYPGNLQADLAAMAAPEPTTASLLLLSVMGWLFRRRPQRAAFARLRVESSRRPHHLQEVPPMISLRSFPLAVACLLVSLATTAVSQAADVSLNTDDGFGASSFNSAGQWSNAAAPSAGNDYFTGTFRLRTPADANSYTFGGDSLTIDPTGAAPGDLLGLSYKGSGDTGTLTINNLILNGGAINHLNGPADIFNLDGAVSVIADSYIYAKQGPINVLADISGTATITNPGSDDTGRTLSFLSSGNTFSGSIVNDGRFTLGDGAVLNFDIGASGVNNSVTGAGPETVFNGVFDFDLSGASSTLGDSWAIAAADNQSFGENFAVSGFQPLGDVWFDGTYVFDTTTGTLAVASPPERLTLQVMSNGQMMIVNDEDSASFEFNYYEVRSESGALTTDGWTGIDGSVMPGETTWEQAGGSSSTLLAETNLSGSANLSPTNSVTLGGGFAGPSADDIAFYYGEVGGNLLTRGFVEFVEVAGLPGDFNDDGSVDAADYTVWRDNLGQSSDALNGNGTGAETVVPADYDLWRQQYGASNAPTAQAASPTPEPTGMLLIGVTLLTGAMLGARQKN